jgi:hypothetical protein
MTEIHVECAAIWDIKASLLEALCECMYITELTQDTFRRPAVCG